MRKILKLLLFLFGVTLIIQALFVFLGDGYETVYTIKNDTKSFLVKEVYKANQKERDDHYIFTINNDFTFSVFNDLNKDSKLIKQIYYYENDQYKCMYPVFKKEKVKTDVLCKKDTLLYYHAMKGKNAGVDTFVSSLKGYNINDFINTEEIAQEEQFIKAYPSNLQKDHFLALQTYKGIYNVNRDDKRTIGIINYYDHDVYDPKLTGRTSKYYITSTYSSEFDFDGFYVIDMVTNQKQKIESKSPISYQSYIQGTLDNCIYIIDKNNQKQYKIDGKKKSMTEIGNAEKGIQFYEDEKWSTKDMGEAIREELLFPNKIEYQNEYYDKITKSKNFYYLFKTNGNQTKVSRTSIDDLTNITYLFTAHTPQSIQYIEDFIYFFEDGKIKYYNDQTGVKTIVEYKEMSFNRNLKYYVYAK